MESSDSLIFSKQSAIHLPNHTAKTKKTRRRDCGTVYFVMQLLQTELLVELSNAAAGIDQLLLASEEGVTLRADFHTNIFLSGTCLNYITAGAFNSSLLIIGMDSFLHCSWSPLF